MDTDDTLSSDSAGPSCTPDLTHTAVQYTTSFHYRPRSPFGSRRSSMNEGVPPTFATTSPGRPSSLSRSVLALPSRHAQTSQGLSYPPPPRPLTLHQQTHMSPSHLSDRSSTPSTNPTRTQSPQPRRSSPSQLSGSSYLPPNATLLHGHSPSIGGGFTPPPQSYPSFSMTGAAGQLPLAPASSIERGDLPRPPGTPRIQRRVPRSVYISPGCVVLTMLRLCSPAPAIGLGQALMRVLQLSSRLAAEDQKVRSLTSHLPIITTV
jgi:hypothetical protein